MGEGEARLIYYGHSWGGGGEKLRIKYLPPSDRSQTSSHCYATARAAPATHFSQPGSGCGASTVDIIAIWQLRADGLDLPCRVNALI